MNNNDNWYGWRFVFVAPSGTRVLSRMFHGITVGWADPDVSMEDTLWWDCTNRHWRTDDEIDWGKDNPKRTYSLSSDAPCLSFKAFKSHLRRHKEKLKDRKVVLSSRFNGHNIIAIPI